MGELEGKKQSVGVLGEGVCGRDNQTEREGGG